MADAKKRKSRSTRSGPEGAGAGARKGAKTWGGRFAKATDPGMERFSASVDVDGALFREDVRGSIAHARMLGRTGIVSAAEAEQLVKGLEQVAHELESGALALDPALEDVHTNIERRLYEVVGAVAGKLHTGRSRNDQIATDRAAQTPMRPNKIATRKAILAVGLRSQALSTPTG